MADHLNWDAQALWRQLDPLLPGISVEVLGRVASTNTRLLERARTRGGPPDDAATRPALLDTLVPAPAENPQPHGRRAADASPCLLVAEEQTGGRGRLGRNWVSRAGSSLTFSLSLPLAPAQWSGLSLAVGLALAQALDPLLAPHEGPVRLGLKWPNDLWLWDGPGRGRKLGGILIETVSVGEQRLCVVGVGLNVLPMDLDGMPHGQGSLQELHPGVSPPQVLALVAAPLVRAVLRFEQAGFSPLVAAYARRDLLLGQAVTTTAPEALEGVAEGVDEQGALRVRSGSLHRVLSGEVSVRLQARGD